MSLIGRFCCRSRLQRIGAFGLSLRAAAYAMHRTWASGGRATSATSRRRLWAMAARTNSSWAPRGPRSRSRPSFRMRFKCANRIFALTSRLLKVFGASKRPGNVSGVFMDVARHLARWVFWTALGFEWAYIAVELAGTIQKCLPKVRRTAAARPAIDVRPPAESIPIGKPVV
jgi:hypothetical protein